MRDAPKDGRVARTATAATELTATLAVVALVVWVLMTGRGGPTAATGDPTPAASTSAAAQSAAGVAGVASPASWAGDASADAASSAGATAETDTASPDAGSPDAPSASPTMGPAAGADATPAPTPRPTPQPTPRTTPRPTPQPTPTPRPTPIIHRVVATGSFGATLVVKGIAVRLAPRDPDPSLLYLCESDDPEMQGWTEQRAYQMTMTWPDPAKAEEPLVQVGAHPFNMMSFDSPVRSGVTTTVTLCHRPGDTERVMVAIPGPPGPDEILVEYAWYFS